MELNRADSEIGPSQIDCQVKTLDLIVRQRRCGCVTLTNFFCTIRDSSYVGGNLTQFGAMILQSLLCMIGMLSISTSCEFRRHGHQLISLMNSLTPLFTSAAG